MQNSAPATAIDTAPLQRVIDMFVAISVKLLEGALDKRGMAKLNTCYAEIARVSKELRRAAVFNRKVFAMDRLRRDSAYRAQLRRELGGFHVLKRWRENLRASNFPRQRELRAKRAQYLRELKANPDMGIERDRGAADFAPRNFERQPPCPAGPDPAAAKKRKPVKTCRAGLFRLAPVPVWLESSTVLPHTNAPGGRARRERGPRRPFAPIPLMPDDLALDDALDDIADTPETAEDESDELSNFEHIRAEEMEGWEWNEAEEDFYPPLIEPDPPPYIRRL